jgi:hypothetical protein
MITLSLKPFFDGHKHCSPLQPLRARHVLPVSLSSLVIRWITPTWQVWSEQNSKSDLGLGSTPSALRLIVLHDLDSTTKRGAGRLAIDGGSSLS